jgi:hypothetical protein
VASATGIRWFMGWPAEVDGPNALNANSINGLQTVHSTTYLRRR